MLIKDVKKLPVYERFLYWIHERAAMLRHRIAGQPRPWTDDEILRDNYFTNVMREDDKTTIWLRNAIREPLKNDKEVVFAVICFRWFNLIDTGRLLVRHDLHCKWDLEKAVTLLEQRRDAGLQVFTGAFNISNSGSAKPKINRVCEDYIQPAWEARLGLLSDIIDGVTLAAACKRLRQLPGLGGSGFMAAQVVADLKYTRWLDSAPDWWCWSSPGPGSRRGIERLLGQPSLDWEKDMTEIRAMVSDGTGLDLHAQDVQSCLCEFDKYERVLWGEGRSKRRYNHA